MLIIFSGLPATGKTSIAKQLTRQTSALLVRVDTIETAIAQSHSDVGAAGYRAAYAIAKENLALGHTVIADSVNAIELTRSAWRDIAITADRPYLEIEIITSDAKLHFDRASSRSSDLPGHTLPSWQQIATREYQPWNKDRLVIDTAQHTITDAVAIIVAELATL